MCDLPVRVPQAGVSEQMLIIDADRAGYPRKLDFASAPAFSAEGGWMFDFINQQTVYVISISGGAPNLRATADRVASVGLSLGPFLGKTTYWAHYEQHRSRDAVGTLPPLTVDVEQAFPERFIRDADGKLIEIDNRSVNLERQNLNDLKCGFNAWIPFGPSELAGHHASRM